MQDLRSIRHSCAHLLAEAVQERFAPEGPVRLAGGPATEDGFYYDFELPRPAEPEDLAWLEERLKALIRRGARFERQVVGPDEARALFAAEPFKLETIAGLLQGGLDADGQSVEARAAVELSVYRHAGFTDLCQGPHVESSAEIDPEAVKLLSLAGAYWRGDEKRPMLQRIYGTAWGSAAELAEFLAHRAEAERRDHRLLGKELDLFFFHPTAPGMPYWLPKGLTILNELIAFWRDEHAEAGYLEVASPLVNEKRLWEESGHWDHYRHDMFVMELPNGQVMGLKPMNCPNAMLVFNHAQRSYRDLPLRLADCDVLHRHERSGSLHGLLRVQKFQQDDAHIFLAEGQLADEFDRILALVDRFYRLFGLEYSFRLATRPDQFLGDIESWEAAEAALRRVLARHAGEGGYEVAPKDGAFYGPKIDILVRDALGRRWQMGTIQLDFQLPRRFGCAYADKDGSRKTPVVLHRVIYGSLERFIGVLLEHTGGDLPLWLAPVQVRILPVEERHGDYAQQVLQRLKRAKLRVEVVDGNTLNARIRAAELVKVPYVLVVGDREAQAGTVALRQRGGKNLGGCSLDEAANRLEAAAKRPPKDAS